MFLFTCFISFFLWRLYKWSQIDFYLRKEEVKNFNNRNDMYTMLLIVRPCPRLQPLLLPRRPRSGHGSHVGGGGSGQGGSRRSGGGGTGIGAGGRAGAGSGGYSSAATTGGGGGSSAATAGGGSSAAAGGGDSAAATAGGGR